MMRLREIWQRAHRCFAIDSWRRALCHALLVLAALGVGALLFVVAGFAPIAADKGHWPITRAFLQVAMSRSVSTHTLGLRAPPLDDPVLIAKGAGHYANGCMPCHGAPGVERPPLVRRMLPEPPPLARTLGNLPPEHLFWIVKHGLKYTAMPAWIAPDRDDEVWAMAAFLQRLPKLTPAQFRALAYGDAHTGDIAAQCTRCHGREGREGEGFPRLAGQSADYLLASLQAFADGKRHSGIMQPVAAALDPQQRQALVEHFAAMTPTVSDIPPATDMAAIARGRALAAHGDGRRRIPACAACHGPGDDARNPMFPSVAGQHADYLALQLRLFSINGRGGTWYAPLMERAAAALNARDIRDLALYYASLPPERDIDAASGGRRKGM